MFAQFRFYIIPDICVFFKSFGHLSYFFRYFVIFAIPRSVLQATLVECKSEGHINYHPAYSTSVTVPFKSFLHVGSSPFYGRFHVFKHSKADETKPSIAEVNVTSPKRSMGGHSLLCYCCLLLFQQTRCQIHLVCRYCLKSHCLFQHLELLTLRKLKRGPSA